MKRGSKLLAQLSTISVQAGLTVFSMLEMIYLFLQPAARPGLEMMWMMPLFFGVCTFAFRKIYTYQGMGFKIYILIAILRYLVQPLLIVWTGGAVSSNRMSQVTPSSYQAATIMACIEIVIAYATIFYLTPRMHNKYRNSKAPEFQRSSVMGLTSGAWLIIALYVLVLLYKLPVWLPALNVFGLKSSNINGILLENTMFSALKSTLFVVLLGMAIRSEGRKRTGFLVLTFISLLFNSATYIGTNRSLPLEIIVASVLMLLQYFPQYKGRIIGIAAPLGVAVVLTMFVTKQFGISGVGDLSSVQIDLQYLSNQLEEYANGPWCMAQSYDPAVGIRPDIGLKAFVKEMVQALMIVLEIPGLGGLDAFAETWDSVTNIFAYSFQIYNRGQIAAFSTYFFYVDYMLGWLLMPIGNFIAIYFLVRYTVKAQYSKTLLKQYVYIWSSILFGLTHCYNAGVLLYCMSKYAWFIYIIYFGNYFRVGLRRRDGGSRSSVI